MPEEMDGSPELFGIFEPEEPEVLDVPEEILEPAMLDESPEDDVWEEDEDDDDSPPLLS